MKNHYWILNDNHTTHTTDDPEEWAIGFENPNRIVAQVNEDGFFISTVFIGINHNFGDGPPHIFETMVFYGPEASAETIDIMRASTWDDALAQHNAMVRKHISARQTIEKKSKEKKDDGSQNARCDTLAASWSIHNPKGR